MIFADLSGVEELSDYYMEHTLSTWISKESSEVKAALEAAFIAALGPLAALIAYARSLQTRSLSHPPNMPFISLKQRR